MFLLFLFHLFYTGLFACGKPESSLAPEYFDLAHAYVQLHRYDEARDYYMRAARDPAYYHAAQYNFARVCGLQNDWKTAVHALQPLYDADSANATIAAAYAYALLSFGETARALLLYQQLYERDQKNTQRILEYANVLVHAKKYIQAVEFLRQKKSLLSEAEDVRVLQSIVRKLKDSVPPHLIADFVSTDDL